MPASYLAAFTADQTRDGLLIVRDREQPGLCLRLPPHAVATERDMYVVRGSEKGSLNDEFERILASKVEGPFVAVRNHLVYGRADGLTERLSVADAEVLCTYLAFQHIRTPAYRDQLQLLEEWTYVAHAHSLFSNPQRLSHAHEKATGRPLSPKEAKSLLDAVESERVRIRPNEKGWLSHAVNHLPRLIGLLEALPRKVFHAPTGILLPTCDSPLVLVRRESSDRFVHGGGWAQPHLEAILPLSPSTVLVVGGALRTYNDQGSPSWFQQVRLRIASGARRWLYMQRDDEELSSTLYRSSAPEMVIEYPNGAFRRGTSAIRAVLDMKAKNVGSALTRFGPRDP